MSAPRPEVIDQAVADAVAKLEQAAVDYRCAHDASYEQRKGGRGGSGTAGDNDVSRLVVSTEPARRKVQAMAKCVLRACGNARRAGVLYGEWTDLIDEGRDLTFTDPEVLRSVFRETRATWAENEAAGREAAAKRGERGASIPGSDYGLSAGSQ